MKTGAVVANGTDAPVEDIDPILLLRLGVPASAGRQRFLPISGCRGWRPSAITINVAFAEFDESIKGSPAALADVTVF